MAERVGIFDSGVGGLSVWREIVRRLSGVETLYIADQAHIPYGSRRHDEVLAFARGISRYLVAERCRTIVVACNTASAAALQTLRLEFPQQTFVGMEPAVKPAALKSQRKIVAVLGTAATLAGELMRRTAARHATGVEILRQPCPGLVERIEAGELQGEALEATLQDFLLEPLAAGADVIVLACTHYPLVRDSIEKIVGPGVQVIDPAAAIAMQLSRTLGELPAVASNALPHEFRTTGAVAAFERVASAILGSRVHATALRWQDGELAG